MTGEQIKALAKTAYCDDAEFESRWADGDFRTFCAALLHEAANARPEALRSEGWKLVPVIPTPEQVAAAIGVIGMARISSDQYQAIYTAMLNAAPQGPASTGATEPCSVLPAGAAPFRPINEREAEIVAFYEAQLERVSVRSPRGKQ